MVTLRSEVTQKVLIRVFCGILAILAMLLLELIQRTIFQKASIESIKNLQENDSKSTIGFFRFIHYLGDARCYYVLVMLFFNLYSRQTSFYFAFVISFCVYVECFLKLVLRAGRPFMKSLKIFPFVCELSFGNPSGEAMMSIAFLITLALYISSRLKEQTEEMTRNQQISIGVASLFSIMMIILFCLQGSYNGNNTIDEIIFGMELGVLIGCFSHVYIRQMLDKHLKDLMDGMFNQRHRLVVMGASLIMLVLFTVITICYLAAASDFVPETLWLQYISMKCPVSKQLTELAFHDASYVEFGLFFYLYGAYLGIVIDSKEYKGSHKFQNQTELKKTLLRLFLSILIIVPLYVLPLFLIKSSKYVLLILVIKYAVPSFLMGFTLYGYSKLLYKRFNLIQDESLNDTSTSFIHESQQQNDYESDEDKNEDSDKEDSSDSNRRSNRLTLRQDKTMRDYDKAMKSNINTF
eukprot:403344328